MFKLNFDVERHFLDNGLEVITIKKDTKISAINVGIKVGSLYENMNEKGISHFIEHMLFKGTKKRSYEELNDELEFLGGEYNAYTDYTSTVYTISCLEEEFKNAIEILGDMIINPAFNKEELEKERGVILAEMRTSKDDIEDLSFKRTNEVAFNKSPLKYDVAGIEANVKNYDRYDLTSFYKKHYIPNNALVTVVSSYNHDEALNEVKKVFKGWEPGEKIKRDILEEKNICKSITTTKSNIEQNTIVYLYTFYNLNRDLELPLRILNHRLGESSNSLLFREVREKRGLAYDIYTSIDMTNSVKTLYIYTAVGEEDLNSAVSAINETISGVKSGSLAIGERDLELMKKVHKTAVISTLEDPSELCNYMLHQGLDGEDLYEFVKDMEKLHSLDINKIQEVAREVLSNPTIHILKS
ncbi:MULTISPECIES: pitrilysin family protein [Clostridium]|jgi:predicted Zn-dependent peptidase|uniref:M16 family metallopeptidase n=1 Tax=Clostridium TaxID=1485 RepID=UPI000BE3BEA8|nr:MULTISPECIES: pitrilysin family protein [Clostridium]MDB1933353.1 pitrilysin family protein [Clostridium tertium]MDB1937499.1 pitrilysin family protein [Clostridium tertium]MDB1969564.1 pitrilysin family protein [Clostridium tertium]MDU2460287.1 pitrilysin family protein [Clostridium sp.]MDU2680691.1 pitrilysin family protein [Clostridium sp.]